MKNVKISLKIFFIFLFIFLILAYISFVPHAHVHHCCEPHCALCSMADTCKNILSMAYVSSVLCQFIHARAGYFHRLREIPILKKNALVWQNVKLLN